MLYVFKTNIKSIYTYNNYNILTFKIFNSLAINSLSSKYNQFDLNKASY